MGSLSDRYKREVKQAVRYMHLKFRREGMGWRYKLEIRRQIFIMVIGSISMWDYAINLLASKQGYSQQGMQ